MFPASTPPTNLSHNPTAVPEETLHMLSAVLKAAFRAYCTGNTVADKDAWQLVRDVQNRLLELSREPEGVVSERRLIQYIESNLTGLPCSSRPTPALRAVM